MEPAAAELAARHAGYSHCTNLSQTFATMVRSRGDSEAYRRADIHFHRTLFAACPDQCYASFDASVARILDCRTQQGLMPAKPVTGDAHAEVLRAVLVGDALGARRATQVITDEAFTAVFERRRMLSTWPLPRMRRSRRGRGADPEDPFT
jgi:DNA-binding FadR family transcriptional regulator